MVIVSPSRQNMHKKFSRTFLEMMWNWSCTKPKHRAGGTGAAGRRSQAPAEQHLWYRFEEKMLSHSFSPPFTEGKWLYFQRCWAPWIPLTSAGTTTVSHLWGQGITSPSYKTNFRHLTAQIFSLVSLQLTISDHNSLMSSFLSHNWCKINLSINHLNHTIRDHHKPSLNIYSLEYAAPRQ